MSFLIIVGRKIYDAKFQYSIFSIIILAWREQFTLMLRYVLLILFYIGFFINVVISQPWQRFKEMQSLGVEHFVSGLGFHFLDSAV